MNNQRVGECLEDNPKCFNANHIIVNQSLPGSGEIYLKPGNIIDKHSLSYMIFYLRLKPCKLLV
jgi:hypothetical protein